MEHTEFGVLHIFCIYNYLKLRKILMEILKLSGVIMVIMEYYGIIYYGYSLSEKVISPN